MATRLTVIDGWLDKTGAYTERAYEVGYDEVCLLLEKLKDTKNSLRLQTRAFCLDFSHLSDTSFEVEIYDIRDGFWAICEAGAVAARGIVELAAADGKFGELVPTTTEVWGAYGGGQFT